MGENTEGIPATQTIGTRVQRLRDVAVYQVGSSALITLHHKTGFVGFLSLDDSCLRGCYIWSHRGEDTLREFLISSSKDKRYIINKLFDPYLLKGYDTSRFWDKLWLPFIETLKQEAAEEILAQGEK